jgi:murein DD-endopeptidase MepM/ murein hydrolase activator NlpD
MARKKPRRYFFTILFLAVLAGVVYLGLAGFRAGGAPVIEIEPELPGIGKRTPVRIAVEEPGRGLSAFTVEVVQGDRVELLEARNYTPLEPWQFWGNRVTREDLTVEVGSETVEGLREGEAIVRVTAERAPAVLRRPAPEVEELNLKVKLRPPVLQVVSSHTYVAQGGCEAVVYKVDDSSIMDGVAVGDLWFPGYALPKGGEGYRFALFGVPFDFDDEAQIRLVALDSFGNEARAAFVDRFFPKPLNEDVIRISDNFLERVVPPIMAQTPELEDRGSLLENYLLVNGELRRINGRTLNELADRSQEMFLWGRSFLQMRNAQVMSNFAERRTYLYNGREIDRQDHLGFDLASTSLAEIQASNGGVVLLARYLGIYGNTVVIDHGYGLMSLYGHMSSIAVEEGQRVERGELIGRTGATGLAGGDHLHFAILIRGLPVNPREWWDGHWIHDRLKLKLGASLPFKE